MEIEVAFVVDQVRLSGEPFVMVALVAENWTVGAEPEEEEVGEFEELEELPHPERTKPRMRTKKSEMPSREGRVHRMSPPAKHSNSEELDD